MKITREGKRFLLATVLIGVAAFNTGNNLIYLILAMMLSILAIAVSALMLNMRGLSLSVRMGGPVFAGEAADMEVSVSNRKRVLPSFSLKVIMPEDMRGECLVAHVGASSTSLAESRVSFRRRGVYRWGDFALESGFPFIFLVRRARVLVEGAVTVYPRLIEVGGVETAPGGAGRSYSIRPGRGEDLLAIREFREGDDVKLISWKASARAQALMVREHAEERPTAVNIVLDDSMPFDAGAFERAVSYAASLAVRLIDEGFYVGLVTSTKRLPYGAGPEHLYRILDVLAVARETEFIPEPMPEEDFGASVLVLKSEASPMRGLEADMVVYASKL